MRKILVVMMLLLVSFSLFAGEITDKDLIRFVSKKCKEYNLPADIVFAIGINESGFRNIRSYSDNSNGSYDIGIFQINSYYVRYYERTFWYREEDFNPWNPYHNCEMAIMYLNHLRKYTGSLADAISAYNTGLRGLKKYPNVGYIYRAKIANSLNSIKVFTEEYIYFDR